MMKGSRRFALSVKVTERPSDYPFAQTVSPSKLRGACLRQYFCLKEAHRYSRSGHNQATRHDAWIDHDRPGSGALFPETPWIDGNRVAGGIVFDTLPVQLDDATFLF